MNKTKREKRPVRLLFTVILLLSPLIFVLQCHLRRSYAHTSALIVSREDKRFPRDGRKTDILRPLLLLNYTAEEQSYSKTILAPEGFTAWPGDTIAISYKRKNPSHIFIVGNDWPNNTHEGIGEELAKPSE